jgi:hypothetical protein
MAVMWKLVRAVLTWLLAAGATFLATVVVNSIGATMHPEPSTYGSSDLQQSISRLGKVLIHVVPGIAIGLTSLPRNWILAGVMSSILLSATWWYFRGAFGVLLLSFPFLEAALLVLLGVVAARMTSTVGKRRSSV